MYGWSNSGHMGGRGLVEDTAHGTLSFILERGEPGQSGTLLFSSATHSPIGVYFGVRAIMHPHMSPRGQIVLVPPPEDLLRHDLVPNGKKRRGTYGTQTRNYRLTFDAASKHTVCLRDQHLFSGVLIGNSPALASFCGSWVVGASRPVPLKTHGEADRKK